MSQENKNWKDGMEKQMGRDDRFYLIVVIIAVVIIVLGMWVQWK